MLDVLIVGGGLSGMALAQRLSNHTAKLQWKLLEARTVLGGRLANAGDGLDIDMGAAWMWPRHQPKISQLVTALGVETFPQPDDSSSTRVVGGTYALIEALAAQVPAENIQVDAPVVSVLLKTEEEEQGGTCSTENEYIEVTTSTQETFRARHVVFAVPPKLISQHTTFTPPLRPEKWKAMQDSHTWMAGVTKVILMYPTRFWNLSHSNMGLPSGGGSGPAFQMYDGSTRDGSIAALTFFTLVPPGFAVENEALAKRVALQLGSVWTALGFMDMSMQVHSYTSFYIQRWPSETYISEDAQPTRIHPHPHAIPVLAAPDWNGRLHFAGSEADQQSAGVMEGAIGSAERVWEELASVLESKDQK